MILVDDASTDYSGGICDEYTKNNGHITTIHKEKNEGLSAARNAALVRAHGTYVTFIDSDDYISEDTLTNLMEELAVHPDYDILEYPVYVHYGDKDMHLLHFPKHEYTDMASYWLEEKAYNHTYACNKIYRRSLFQKVRFPVGKNFEDAWTLPQLLKHCSTVATTSVGLYYYCANPHGITRQAKEQDLISHLDAHLKVLQSLRPTSEQHNYPQRLDAQFADYYAAVLNILLDATDKASGSKQRKDIVKSFPILPYKQTFKLKLLYIFGLNLLCQLHRTFRHSH